MKTRRNIWPWGTNQPLGPRVSYGKRTRAAGRTRESSPAMSERQEKAAAAAKRAAKLDDPNLERKLKAWYAKGGNLNEFLQANPSPGLKAYPTALLRGMLDLPSQQVSATQKKAVAKELERRAGKRNPADDTYNVYYDGRHAGQVFASSKKQALYKAVRDDEIIKHLGQYKEKVAVVKAKRNPSAAAAEVYEEFHGMPSAEIITVKQRLKYHGNLAALGDLEYLFVQKDGYERKINFVKAGVVLCCNERKNQMFLKGGDQSLGPEKFGYREWPHEKNTLGVVSRLEYFTTKKHLGKEGGTAIYFHLPAEPERGRSAGVGPDLIYDAVNEALEFSGGTYTILAEGISR